MSRIQGHILTQTEFPCGRLVMTSPNYDSAEKVINFIVPSDSRVARVYGIEVDCLTGEIACACEDFEIRKRWKCGRRNFGTYLEHRAYHVARISMLPSVTRTHKGLCKHCRRVKRWLQRHGVLEHIKTVVTVLEGRLDDIEAQQKKLA